MSATVSKRPTWNLVARGPAGAWNLVARRPPPPGAGRCRPAAGARDGMRRRYPLESCRAPGDSGDELSPRAATYPRESCRDKTRHQNLSTTRFRVVPWSLVAATRPESWNLVAQQDSDSKTLLLRDEIPRHRDGRACGDRAGRWEHDLMQRRYRPDFPTGASAAGLARQDSRSLRQDSNRDDQRSAR